MRGRRAGVGDGRGDDGASDIGSWRVPYLLRHTASSCTSSATPRSASPSAPTATSFPNSPPTPQTRWPRLTVVEGPRGGRGHKCNHAGTIDLEAFVSHDPAWSVAAVLEPSITAGHKAKARSEDRAFAHVRRVGLEPTTRGLRVRCSAS